MNTENTITSINGVAVSTELKKSVIAAYADYFDEFVNAMTEDGGMSLHDAIDYVYDHMEIDTDYCCTEAIVERLIDDGMLTEDEVWDEDWHGASVIHDLGMIGVKEARAAAEWDDMENMNNIIAEKQTEFNELVGVLGVIAPSYDAMTSKLQHLRATAIIKKLAVVAEKCLDELGEYNHCEMCVDDGWYIDTSSLCKWYYGYSTYDNMGWGEIDELAEECLYNAMWEDRIVPMTADEFDEFCDWTETTYGHATTYYTDWIGVDWETYEKWEQNNWDMLADMAMAYKAEA